MRWIDEYGWRPLDPLEVQALTRVFTTRFGELMGIKDLPTTYDGYLALLDDYEREHFAFDPANRRVTEAIPAGRRRRRRPCAPLVRRVTIALMDEPLRVALGMPHQPAWFVTAVRPGCGCGPASLRLAPPPRAVPPPPVELPRTATRSATSARPRCSTSSRGPQRPRDAADEIDSVAQSGPTAYAEPPP